MPSLDLSVFLMRVAARGAFWSSKEFESPLARYCCRCKHTTLLLDAVGNCRGTVRATSRVRPVWIPDMTWNTFGPEHVFRY